MSHTSPRALPGTSRVMRYLFALFAEHGSPFAFVRQRVILDFNNLKLLGCVFLVSVAADTGACPSHIHDFVGEGNLAAFFLFLQVDVAQDKYGSRIFPTF